MKPTLIRRVLTVSALVLVAAACTKKTDAGGAAATAQMPQRWSELHLPTDGLKQLLPRTNDHGYYADYSGDDPAPLWAKVSAALAAAGYAPACTLFEGRVRGFSKGGDKLAAKIDSLDGTLVLAIFDEQGKEALLHGACFGKYTVGPPQPVK